MTIDEDIERSMLEYLERRNMNTMGMLPRDPDPAPPVLSWIWMATFYAASTLAAIVAIWELDTIGRIIKVALK